MTRPSLLRALAAFALAAAAACTGTEPVGYDFQKEDGEGELGIWVHSGLYNREYDLRTPPGMTPGERRPLLIFLHGEGDSGPGFRRRLRADAATDRLGFITVWPSGMEGSWTVGCGFVCTTAESLKADDVAFLETLVRHLAARLPVDTTRVYLMGFSQGGQLAQHFACTSDLELAGIGVVAGPLYRRAALECAPRGDFPVGIVHGDADPVIYFTGFGPGAVVMSVPETVETWVGHMGCRLEADWTLLPDTAGDFTEISAYRFLGCRPGSAVSLYVVHEGGHNWPGNTGPWPIVTGLRSRNLDATGELLALFVPGASSRAPAGLSLPASPSPPPAPATATRGRPPSRAAGSPGSPPDP